MCGIAGAIGQGATEITRRMTAALVHRGPDDDGYLASGETALGFRRLSIIDVDGGHQPISNETRDIHLICNGEIYNSPVLRRRLAKEGHRFRSRSDVEVILHLYESLGTSCVDHLRGMFAFAIWDARERRLFAARDRFGIKPLYYVSTREGLAFASEVRALLAEAVAAYVARARTFEPADAQYLLNHRGHLMFVKPEERDMVTAELIRDMTFTAPRDDLPVFHGGLVGYFGYDTVRYIEPRLMPCPQIFNR